MADYSYYDYSAPPPADGGSDITYIDGTGGGGAYNPTYSTVEPTNPYLTPSSYTGGGSFGTTLRSSDTAALSDLRDSQYRTMQGFGSDLTSYGRNFYTDRINAINTRLAEIKAAEDKWLSERSYEEALRKDIAAKEGFWEIKYDWLTLEPPRSRIRYTDDLNQINKEDYLVIIFGDQMGKWLAGGDLFNSIYAGGALFNVTGSRSQSRFLGLTDKNYDSRLNHILGNNHDFYRVTKAHIVGNEGFSVFMFGTK
jgi:hypothetical protein